MRIEDLVKIVASGFGIKFLMGALVGALENVTPYDCYEYIRDNVSLFDGVSDSQWENYRQMAEGTNIESITLDDIINVLRKHRLDLLGVIINDPKGMNWLQSQFDIIRFRLGLE